MKLIIAYVQPERLNDVKQELFRAGNFKMSVTNALGCGQQKGYQESYRGARTEVNLLKKVRLEIAVNREFVDSGGDYQGGSDREYRGRQDLCAGFRRVYPDKNPGNRKQGNRIIDF